MITWCDVDEIRVVAIFKRKEGIHPTARAKYQYNRQIACCALHGPRCHDHRVVSHAVNKNMTGDGSLVVGASDCGVEHTFESHR